MECWMFRAVRLLFSNNADDYSKLYQMFQDSLDHETEHKVTKMTPKDAMQDVSIKSSIKVTDTTKKVKNIEPSSSITSTGTKQISKRQYPYKENTDETEKKKIQLLTVDLFGPTITATSDIKRRRNVSSSISQLTKERTNPPESVMTSDMLSGEVIQEFTDLHCQICHSLTLSSDNMIIECQKCRNLYHQKCHQPHVSQSAAVQLNWKCKKCVDNEDNNDSTVLVDKNVVPIDLTVTSFPMNI